jgi:hypothetical protein
MARVHGRASTTYDLHGGFAGILEFVLFVARTAEEDFQFLSERQSGLLRLLLVLLLLLSLLLVVGEFHDDGDGDDDDDDDDNNNGVWAEDGNGSGCVVYIFPLDFGNGKGLSSGGVRDDFW